MAENGFVPRKLFGIRERWDSKSITDLMDSYGQEWVSTQYCQLNSYLLLPRTCFRRLVLLLLRVIAEMILQTLPFTTILRTADLRCGTVCYHHLARERVTNYIQDETGNVFLQTVTMTHEAAFLRLRRRDINDFTYLLYCIN